jgi:hypothetical protein
MDGLLHAIQSALMGRIPVNVVTPALLQGILRNVLLQLPEGYSLVA